MSGADRNLTSENYEAARRRWAVVAQVVADHEGVHMVKVRFAGGGGTRAGADLIRARKISCYLAQTAAELSGHALSNVSGLSRKTIREHVQAIEDARDNPVMSAELDALTAEIQLILARKAFADERRARAEACDFELPPAPLPTAEPRQVDPVLIELLSAMERAEQARDAWRTLCKDEGRAA